MSRKRRIAAILACVAAILALAACLWSPAARIARVERAALAQLGKPYVFGAAGPDAFDCSGLMTYAYARAGVRLAHHAETVANDARFQTISDFGLLRRGDLVFFNTVSGGGKIDHVGLWLGGNRFVHASSAVGEVMISDFDEKWQRRFTWAKRIF